MEGKFLSTIKPLFQAMKSFAWESKKNYQNEQIQNIRAQLFEVQLRRQYTWMLMKSEVHVKLREDCLVFVH